MSRSEYFGARTGSASSSRSPKPCAVVNRGILSSGNRVPSSGREEVVETCFMWKVNSRELFKSMKATLFWIIELYRVAIAEAKLDVLIISSHTRDMGNSRSAGVDGLGGYLYLPRDGWFY